LRCALCTCATITPEAAGLQPSAAMPAHTGIYVALEHAPLSLRHVLVCAACVRSAVAAFARKGAAMRGAAS
jgi:hypothetical protein